MNFLTNLVDYCRNLTEAKESQKSIKYVIGEDGIYEIRQNALGTFTVKTNKVIGAEKINEGVEFNIPKIPFILFQQIYSFFKDINDDSHDEVMIQIFLNKQTNEYFLHCPKQKISGVNITFEREQSLYDNEDFLLVMDIHSHNSMNAFFSSTDDSSEKETRIYGVIGRLSNYTPEFKFRVSIGGKFRTIDVYDIFEEDENCNLNGIVFNIPKIEYPSDWNSQLTKVPVLREIKPYFNNSYNYNSGYDYENNYYYNSGYDYRNNSSNYKVSDSPKPYSFYDMQFEDNTSYNQMEIEDYNSSFRGYSKSICEEKQEENLCFSENTTDGTLTLSGLYGKLAGSFFQTTKEESKERPENEKIKREIEAYDPEKDEYFGLSFMERISKMKEKKEKEAEERRKQYSNNDVFDYDGRCLEDDEMKQFTDYITSIIGTKYYYSFITPVNEADMDNLFNISSARKVYTSEINKLLCETYALLSEYENSLSDLFSCMLCDFTEFMYCYMNAFNLIDCSYQEFEDSLPVDVYVLEENYLDVVSNYKFIQLCDEIKEIGCKKGLMIYFINLITHLISNESESSLKEAYYNVLQMYEEYQNVISEEEN